MLHAFSRQLELATTGVGLDGTADGMQLTPHALREECQRAVRRVVGSLDDQQGTLAERSKTAYIALDVDGMTENDERSIVRAGHSYGLFRVEPNGYRCLALVLC